MKLWVSNTCLKNYVSYTREKSSNSGYFQQILCAISLSIGIGALGSKPNDFHSLVSYAMILPEQAQSLALFMCKTFSTEM